MFCVQGAVIESKPMSLPRMSATSLLLPLVLALVPYLTATSKDETQSAPNGCATCHRKISETYAKSAMSRTSGHAAENLMPGDYQNKDSGVRYRVFERKGRAW